jgi:hypothetical protein
VLGAQHVQEDYSEGGTRVKACIGNVAVDVESVAQLEDFVARKAYDDVEYVAAEGSQ